MTDERIEDVIAEMREHVPYCSDADLDRLTAALERERADHAAEIERLRKGQWPPPSVSEALNSGDGSYKP